MESGFRTTIADSAAKIDDSASPDDFVPDAVGLLFHLKRGAYSSPGKFWQKCMHQLWIMPISRRCQSGFLFRWGFRSKNWFKNSPLICKLLEWRHNNSFAISRESLLWYILEFIRFETSFPEKSDFWMRGGSISVDSDWRNIIAVVASRCILFNIWSAKKRTSHHSSWLFTLSLMIKTTHLFS